MNDYITWELLSAYATFVTIVFMVVEFTKTLPYINKIDTKYYSFLVALLLIVIVQIQGKTFVPFDIVLYILTAISVSLGSNGLANFGKKGSEGDVK
jgi:hypothetical protein